MLAEGESRRRCRLLQVGCLRLATSTYRRRWRRRRWATTWARILDHCADMNGAPLTRTPPRRSWGRGPSPPGWRRIQARRLTCLLLRAMQRRRVESLVLGALSSSPVHRALVLGVGTNIAVLLGCSKSSRQCNLSFLLTYFYCITFLSLAGRASMCVAFATSSSVGVCVAALERSLP